MSMTETTSVLEDASKLMIIKYRPQGKLVSITDASNNEKSNNGDADTNANQLAQFRSQLIPSPPLSPSVTTRNTPASSAIGTPVKTFSALFSNKNFGSNADDSQSTTIAATPFEELSSYSDQGDNGRVSVTVLQPDCSFPLAKLQDYSLKINAWEKVHEASYKRKCFSFLNQYFAGASKKEYYKTSRKEYSLYKKSHGSSSSANVSASSSSNKRRHQATRDYTSESDSGFERIRTRRSTKRTQPSTFSPSNRSFGANLINVSGSELESANIAVVSPKKKRKVKAESSPAKPSFVDWESIPDYSPSLDTLPKNNSRCLNTEWKGQPMDLSSDALVHKLHLAEVHLASVLRLPCNVYLDSKRRLFQEKVARLKKGLPFRRTDAQKACRIDVNKASRLFAAFEKAGWLEDYHFEKYL